MKTYKVQMSPRAKADLRNRISYLVNVKKNPQAASSLMADFVKPEQILNRKRKIETGTVTPPAELSPSNRRNLA